MCKNVARIADELVQRRHVRESEATPKTIPPIIRDPTANRINLNILQRSYNPCSLFVHMMGKDTCYEVMTTSLASLCHSSVRSKLYFRTLIRYRPSTFYPVEVESYCTTPTPQT